MSRTLVIEPLYCSQGGIPYNKAHLDAKDAEIERLTRWHKQACDDVDRLATENEKQEAEIERLLAALQALHDWYVEYARINNLFNADGSPATFHELLEARHALENKP